VDIFETAKEYIRKSMNDTIRKNVFRTGIKQLTPELRRLLHAKLV